MKLKLSQISKSYGIVKALQNVDFELIEGEVHAICGENGAGKSTLMNVLSGNILPDNGQIVLDGVEIKISSQKHAASLGVAIVYQQLSLFENQTVAENIFVNQFPKTKLGWVDSKKLKQKTVELLKKLNINQNINPDQLVAELSPGQKQMVEIAKALSKNSSILILDEPTASISEIDKNTLFEVIRNLKKQKTAIIYISHRMEEIFEIADRVTVLKDGKFVDTKAIKALNRSSLINLMVGREVLNLAQKAQNTNDVLFEVKNLTNNKVKDVSFKIHKGEIVALAGLVGAGRTEIAKTIFGALSKKSGHIFLKNKAVIINNTADAISNKIAYVPEERKNLGLFLEMEINENIDSINYSNNNKVFFNRSKATKTALKFKENLRISCSSINQKVVELSGGNQQKVVLAKWLSNNPDLLIIDEPTHGIDIGAKFEIYELLQTLADQGKAILLISSELSEIFAIANRVLVVKNGQIKKELFTSNTTEQEIMAWAM